MDLNAKEIPPSSLTGNLPTILKAPQTDWKSYFFYGVVALVILLEIVFGLMFFPDHVKGLMSNSSELETLKSETQGVESQVSALASVDQNKINAEFLAASAVLPSEKKISGLVTGLSSLASTSAMAVKELSFSPGKISTRSASQVLLLSNAEVTEHDLTNGVKGIPITMTVLATESQLTDFMRKISTVSPLLGLSKMSFVVSAQDRLAQILLLIYYQPSEAMTDQTGNVSLLTTKEEETLLRLEGLESIVAP